MTTKSAPVPRKSVSDFVKLFEERSQPPKVKPPDIKTTLIRDVFRNGDSVDRFKKYRESYLLKLQKAKYTTWHVNIPISDDSDASTEYIYIPLNINSQTYPTNSTSMIDSNRTRIENPEPSRGSTEVIIRSQVNCKNDLSEIDTTQCEITNTVSVDDIKILTDNTVQSSNAIVDAEPNSSDMTHSSDADDIVAIRSDHKESMEQINKNATDNESARTSLNNVVSWIKECQFDLPESETLPNYETFENGDIYRESDVQKKPKLVCVKVMEVASKENGLKEAQHPYENIEIYRETVQKEVTLIENIERLEDNDEVETATIEDYVEEDKQDIPEIQYVNATDMFPENLLQYRNSRALALSKSTESLAFHLDEVDIAPKDMFGEGSFTFKVRTSYWEVINPKHNKNAPEQFFNEVNHLTSIPINIAKCINKKKGSKDYDKAEGASKYYSQESLTLTSSYKERCDSYQSAETLGSDDFLAQMSDHDHDSGTEEYQNGSGLIRTDSKLVRVDQTYYNNCLRITKNVVLKDLTKDKPKSEHVVDELVKTERNNLFKLEYVRDKYMMALYNDEKYEHIRDTLPHIFLNWNLIYLRACKFYEQIEVCGYNYEALADCIYNSVSMFEAYSEYCKEKAQYEIYLQGEVKAAIEEVQENLKDKLGLSSYLVEPIQRLTKYKLLLESLQKALNKTGDFCPKLNIAIDMIKQITSESNDCIDAYYIKGFPYELKDQGRIIRKDTFNVVTARKKTKWTDMKIFLFEKVLIITAPMKSSDGYLYKDHIFMDNMMFNYDTEKNRKFNISDFNKNKQAKDKNYKSFICTHKDVDVATEWKILIHENLMTQLIKIKDAANSKAIRQRKR